MIATYLVIGEVILYSNIYAPTNFQGKRVLWSHIRLICSMLTFPLWILTRDFNAICELAEKRGGGQWKTGAFCTAASRQY